MRKEYVDIIKRMNDSIMSKDYKLLRSKRKKFYDHNTKNKSFIEMHNFLKKHGIRNNEFHLELLNENLVGVDPYKVDLSQAFKMQIILECVANPWYFLREVYRARVVEETVTEDYFILDQVNMASWYGFMHNLNIIYDIPYASTCKDIDNIGKILYLETFGSPKTKVEIYDGSELSGDKFSQIVNIMKNRLPKFIVEDENVCNNKSEINLILINNPEVLDYLEDIIKNGKIITDKKEFRFNSIILSKAPSLEKLLGADIETQIEPWVSWLYDVRISMLTKMWIEISQSLKM